MLGNECLPFFIPSDVVVVNVHMPIGVVQYLPHFRQQFAPMMSRNHPCGITVARQLGRALEDYPWFGIVDDWIHTEGLAAKFYFGNVALTNERIDREPGQGPFDCLTLALRKRSLPSCGIIDRDPHYLERLAPNLSCPLSKRKRIAGSINVAAENAKPPEQPNPGNLKLPGTDAERWSAGW